MNFFSKSILSIKSKKKAAVVAAANVVNDRGTRPTVRTVHQAVDRFQFVCVFAAVRAHPVLHLAQSTQATVHIAILQVFLPVGSDRHCVSWLGWKCINIKKKNQNLAFLKKL